MKIHKLHDEYALLKSIIDRKNNAVIIAETALKNDEVIQTIQFLERNAPKDILMIIKRPLRTWAGHHGDVYFIGKPTNDAFKAAAGVSFHKRHEIFELVDK